VDLRDEIFALREDNLSLRERLSENRAVNEYLKGIETGW
jgi:hypothetical protein